MPLAQLVRVFIACRQWQTASHGECESRRVAGGKESHSQLAKGGQR